MTPETKRPKSHFHIDLGPMYPVRPARYLENFWYWHSHVRRANYLISPSDPKMIPQNPLY